MNPYDAKPVQRLLKRAFDFCAALGALIILSPVMAAAALAVWRSMGRPVFFRQPRPGYRGRIFDIVKFRTMSDERGPDGELLPDAQRLTRVGNFIRSTSLDELPQFWNVLKGDLSIVGPRPLLVEYLPLYNPTQARRHDMPPGIIGWAAVNGRNAISWEKKFELDVYYVDHWSLWLDLKIFFLAVKTVLSRSGINEADQATMSKFTGTKPLGPTE